MLSAVCPKLLGPRDLAKQTPGLTFSWWVGLVLPQAQLFCVLRPQCAEWARGWCAVQASPCTSPSGPTADSLSWLWFQIFGIFLAKTLISDIEAVKAGHHF